MPISDNQQQDSALPLQQDADKEMLPDGATPAHAPSEVAMRLNVLGKLIIPPTSLQ